MANWNVVRMVRFAPHPYTTALAQEWIATHAAEREAGTAVRFVIERDGRMIGLCDIGGIVIEDASGSLGYWLDEAAWGRGFATEAAQAVVAFGFEQLSLRRLTSGHAADNQSSGRVLTKLGFRKIGETRVWSIPRDGEIEQWQYEYRTYIALR